MKLAVIIPAYKVKEQILSVLKSIPTSVSKIYLIDDACPEQSGKFAEANCQDPRLKVIYHDQNKGVGGAVISGYQAALADGCEILIKIDGDGQMDCAKIPELITPLVNAEADYTKGNRFYDLETLSSMPKIRLIGNAALSLMAKLSTGYWDLFDPTNGYTAITAQVARQIPWHKVSPRYFFETDLLFRLSIVRAVVRDIPMPAIYAGEVSNLKVSQIIGEFLFKHVRNFLKRLFYNYYLRDMSLASLELPIGLLLIIAGGSFGAYHWLRSISDGIVTSAGTVMLAALPVLAGIQLVLAFLNYDISNVPRHPKSRLGLSKN